MKGGIFMTANQIAYWVNEENKRANLVREEISRNTLAENTRHNITGEGIQQQNADTSLGVLKESGRHNLITESQTNFVNRENKRHNIKSENLTDKQIKENKRHNVKTERYQFATLPIMAQQASAASAQASASLSNAKTNLQVANTKQFEADTGRARATGDIILKSGDQFGAIPVIGRYAEGASGLTALYGYYNALGSTYPEAKVSKKDTQKANSKKKTPTKKYKNRFQGSRGGRL